MDSGKNSINLITDGSIMVDGGSAFGQIPKTEWESHSKPDRRNRIKFGINSLVIKTPNANILVDTGVGSKIPELVRKTYHINGNKLLRGLKKLNLTAKDIDIVLLTHLHFDHSGGCTKINRSGESVPIFPKARHIVQKACWDEAIKPNERFSNTYFQEDFLPLKEKGLLELIDGDMEVTPGVEVKVADGPSKGHQMVLIKMGSERVVYAGDLIPTAYHLQPQYIAATDEFPNETLVQKKELLKMAMEDGWIVIFGHEHEKHSGYIEDWNGKPHLLPRDV